MKLFEISQGTTLQAASDDYLVMALGGGRAGEEFFVISDVPPINEKQFDHLMDVSFGDVTFGGWLDMAPANLTDDIESDEWMAQAAEDPFKVMKWKEFADMIIDNFSDESEDDFDE